ncbi:glycosyltransferase family 4 protein [Ruminococcus flavefaciens]|uniref:glycosyltransferase family 4 protein n=1 Tax=Ruminococcus flavefaciens TaxID=1265 RepID=UPI0026E92542|nr:glycosyltransferase family 4 protein [Ruminococcus flavefaciens]
MITTVAQTYPTENNLYNNGFVHARVKEYIHEGIEANVYVLCNRSIKSDYSIEGVDVMAGNVSRLVDYVNNNKEVTCVCFHFLNPSMLKAIQHFRKNIKLVVFVHGNEALWWHERIFPDRFSGFIRTLKFIKYMIVNTYSINYIRKRINNIDNSINIVCVSEWMKNVAVKNWKIDEKKVQAHIIPNIVNENIFKYEKKDSSLRYNILLIRQFTSGKYALDIAMDTIKKLEEYPEAEKIRITVIGRGWLYKKYTDRIKNFRNVTLHETFLTQSEIASKHKENGIFICPTRQDAQGVSMCEAMSSGLIPISSCNTAIPEFLPKEFNLAFDTAVESAERIIEIIRNPDLFDQLSGSVSQFIQSKCNSQETVIKEIDLIKSMM